MGELNIYHVLQSHADLGETKSDKAPNHLEPGTQLKSVLVSLRPTGIRGLPLENLYCDYRRKWSNWKFAENAVNLQWTGTNVPYRGEINAQSVLATEMVFDLKGSRHPKERLEPTLG